jgi:hypothetical protein
VFDMRSFIAVCVAPAIPLGNPSSTNAQSDCSKIIDDNDRLKCFDAQTSNSDTECKIENFNFTMRGTAIVKMQGTTSCGRGRLDYSLFDADGQFLDAGFHYFDGFVFEAYPDISPPVPDGITMEYTISPRS